jgi:hypothetical protein
MEQMISLFDYLGRAAGSALGKQVALVAKAEKIPVAKKYVENSKYRGEIFMYPKDWLDIYFGRQEPKTATEILYNEPDKLPF